MVSIASFGASAPAGTCHACQYRTTEGMMGDPSGLVPTMVRVTSSTIAPPRGDAWASCQVRPPAVAVYRSHCPSMSTPVTAILEGFSFPSAETLPLSAENDALLPSSELEVKLARQSPFFGQ